MRSRARTVSSLKPGYRFPVEPLLARAAWPRPVALHLAVSSFRMNCRAAMKRFEPPRFDYVGMPIFKSGDLSRVEVMRRISGEYVISRELQFAKASGKRCTPHHVCGKHQQIA